MTLPNTDLDPRMNITLKDDVIIISTECGLLIGFDGKGLQSVASVSFFSFALTL